MSLWLALVAIVLNRAFNDFFTVPFGMALPMCVCVETAFYGTPAEHFARIFLNAKSTVGRGDAPYGRP